MRGERPSPLYTPTSPLSPVQNPAAAPVSAHSAARTKNSNTLRLTNIARLTHPAQQPTVASLDDMAKPPLQLHSPKGQTHPRHYSDAQTALQHYQREIIASATRTRNVTTAITYKPLSPRLLPLGSPGPVTPLKLEEDGGYLMTGANKPSVALDEGGQRELVEKLIEEERQRTEPHVVRPAAISPAGGTS